MLLSGVCALWLWKASVSVLGGRSAVTGQERVRCYCNISYCSTSWSRAVNLILVPWYPSEGCGNGFYDISTFRLYSTYCFCGRSGGVILKYCTESVCVYCTEKSKSVGLRDLWEGGMCLQDELAAVSQKAQCINPSSLKLKLSAFLHLCTTCFVMRYRLLQLFLSKCRTPPHSLSF